ncbi:polyhydroxyalkanoic acid system family protein [Methylobacterium sp. Leaf118]|uniref:polyhydroxyalkanoic acid system family protein n=1 Tax=Methylobacterium sp. Leaf118 TaxID=2876562 RepID=UPI001E521B0E|nr:polyhydroxyalkanoic acid system family protein [Methylobacterium sp. Leaf118]
MAKPMVVEIPHELGRDEARRRIDEGTAKARAALDKSGIAINTLTWTGDRLDYSVTALAQTVDGQIDVGQDMVRVEVRMPLLLSIFAARIQKIIGKEGNNLLLTKK